MRDLSSPSREAVRGDVVRHRGTFKGCVMPAVDRTESRESAALLRDLREAQRIIGQNKAADATVIKELVAHYRKCKLDDKADIAQRLPVSAQEGKTPRQHAEWLIHQEWLKYEIAQLERHVFFQGRPQPICASW